MEDKNLDSNVRRGSTVAGLSAVGALLTGAGGIFGCLIAANSHDHAGGGTYLLAAAVAFGLLANAVFRR